MAPCTERITMIFRIIRLLWSSMINYTRISRTGRVVSAYALDRHGIAAAVSKMAFGNGMGVKIEHNLDPRDFFAPAFGDIICEVPDGQSR